MSDYETIIASREGRVQVIQLNRPKALNALNAKLIAEVLDVCQAADADEGVGCILIKGSEKAFAAGADISEMADKDYDHIYCLLYTSPSPRDKRQSRMPSSA